MDKRVGLNDLFAMRKRMDRMLNDREAALQEQLNGEAVPCWRPEVDVFDAGDQLIFQAELPGVNRDDFTLTVENHSLIIEGERRLPSQSRNARRVQTERRYGPFRRTLDLPDNTVADAISAQLSDGLLEIVIPKKLQATPKRITVESEE